MRTTLLIGDSSVLFTDEPLLSPDSLPLAAGWYWVEECNEPVGPLPSLELAIEEATRVIYNL